MPTGIRDLGYGVPHKAAVFAQLGAEVDETLEWLGSRPTAEVMLIDALERAEALIHRGRLDKARGIVRRAIRAAERGGLI